MTQISLKYYTEPSNTVQKPSNYLKLPSIRGRNSKLALNLHYWFKKSLINLGNYTMIQDFKKFSSGRADLSSKFSRAGPTRSQNSPGPGRADSGRKFFRAGPTRSQNSPGPGRLGPKIPPGRAGDFKHWSWIESKFQASIPSEIVIKKQTFLRLMFIRKKFFSDFSTK